MNSNQVSILFCRFVGLFLLVSGLIAALPKAFLCPYSFSDLGALLPLAYSPSGHEFISDVLRIVVGDLFLVFGSRLGSWLASSLHTPSPNNALQRTEAGGRPVSGSHV